MDYRIKQLAPRYHLTPNEGPSIEVERIGRGRYCTAYRDLSGDRRRVYLRVKPEDNSKHILSDCPQNPYLPELEQIGSIGDDDLWRTWFYNRLTARAKHAWAEYRILQKAQEEVRGIRFQDRPGYALGAWGYDAMAAIIERVQPQSERLAEVLQTICDSAANYGSSYTFEFAPRNLATDDNGYLILLDPVFDLEEVMRANHEARKRAERRRYAV
jgi:hypothetical protein